MLLFIGHDLRGKGLYLDPQLERRVTPLGLEPFRIEDERGRLQWRSLLLALEQRLVLAEKYPGMLADDLADDLFARTTGHIGSLMTLLMRACERAVRTGEERAEPELIDTTFTPRRCGRDVNSRTKTAMCARFAVTGSTSSRSHISRYSVSPRA
ncbi:hypothetical protein KCMC57_up00750 [Kitasatospora sp. CMC57]|uniref:Uncharacterized protein n=1 Tax=Kitasatospora sp. CMC57 TaxID=3231513 RepID=A0AB33JKA7_9ACTN